MLKYTIATLLLLSSCSPEQEKKIEKLAEDVVEDIIEDVIEDTEKVIHHHHDKPD